MKIKQEKIPKTIHYCWFGKGEKPEIVNKCISSWNKYLNEYEIIEWNENNFNIDINNYVREAYDMKKFAFVSDYVRVYALYNYGGIYLDTDVEVFKNFDELLENESFWGFEQENYIATSTIGSKKGNQIIKDFLDTYKEKSFINEDGTFDELTNVAIVTKMLEGLGLKKDGTYQELKHGTFYPQTLFSPYDYINCRKFITKDTYCMHHFYKSWLSPKARFKGYLKHLLSRVIGGHNIAKIRKVIDSKLKI